ncbi:protein SDA1 homolog [Phlebotomus argentipes]|uniref:protein SDA1 homolog n=1 Tax=Phlebotomus argentipes TaxID=94469 RepID=UPI002892DADC|nr:protein SDA1 homolog [Phlebotomus argentipes]
MGKNTQLVINLPQLQNLIKKDPASYKDDFVQQYSHFENTLEIFKYTPDQPSKSLEDSVTFVAQVAQLYLDVCKDFPQQLIDVLKTFSINLDPTVRNALCKALILLRNKNLIPALQLLELFFQLLRCPDKNFREFVRTHIITDIKNINAKNKDMKLNSTLQSFMYTMLDDSNPKCAKMSADIMIELYKKNIWNDAKTVNVIASVGCFSKVTKVLVASLRFFLGTDDKDEESGSDSEAEPDLRNALMVNKVNKKTKKRKKQLEAAKKQYAKAKKKKTSAPSFNFSALHLIHNPQGMAENLFKQLQSSNERFELKLLHLDVISRLVGVHELFLFSFYPYITRFLNPHQRQVTRIMQFAAQSAHELVPGDVFEPVLKTIVNNFVSERNSSDVMAIGLNAIREICARCPLAMNEDMLSDLVMYKTYKQKSVMMAARSLIMLYREQIPQLLHKRDRGRPTEASADLKAKEYGEVVAMDTIPGADVLVKEKKRPEDEVEEDEDSDSDAESEWEDEEDSDEEGWVNVSQDDEPGEEEEEKESEDPVDAKEAAKEILLSKILTDEDFKAIDVHNVKRHLTGARKKNEPAVQEKTELVNLDAIEMIYKKRRNDKEARLATVEAGRVDRVKYGYRDNRKNIHCSRTNREKKKNKNFLMMRHKARSKVKKSFRDKQLALRNHLLKQKKMK